MAQESRLCLPTEIIDEIVGYHGEMEEDGKAPATLLACLATSKQFRQCALRYLCADAPVYLDRPNQLKRLCDCIISAGVSPYMKSIAIVFSSKSPLGPDTGPPRLNEKIVLPLLNTILRKLTLRKLTLQGLRLPANLSGNLPWPQVPRKTRLALQSFMRVPTVTSISIRSFQDVPPELLSQCSYESFTFVDGSMSTSSSVVKVNTTYLTLESAQFMNISLPNLRHFKARSHHRYHHKSIWEVMNGCHNTLETIEIREDPSSMVYIPPDIKLHVFPMLAELTYSVFEWRPGSEISPTFFNLFPAPQTSNMASNLKILNMKFELRNYGDVSAENFWTTKLAGSPVGRSWIDLDKILAKKIYFPALRKVSIYFKFMKRGDSFADLLAGDLLPMNSVDTTALQEEVQGVLGKMFSASIKASVPLEFIVDIDIQTKRAPRPL